MKLNALSQSYARLESISQSNPLNALPGVPGWLADHTLNTLSFGIQLFIWPPPGSGYMRDDMSLSGKGRGASKITSCVICSWVPLLEKS